jgi:hypothetical protein
MTYKSSSIAPIEEDTEGNEYKLVPIDNVNMLQSELFIASDNVIMHEYIE